MEQPIISGIAFNRDEAKLTIRGVPDIPGVAFKILGPISAANIEVDMIVQNVAHDNTTDFTFTVHRNDYNNAMGVLEKVVAALYERAELFRSRVIMARHGFRILSMWETRSADRTEFAYLLAWPDLETKAARWASFMADPEWIEIKRVSVIEHGDLVGAIEDRTLTPTAYSPQL